MKLIPKQCLLIATLLFSLSQLYGQEEKKEVDHSYKPLILKLDDSGNKYIRFITWHQIQLFDGNLDNDANPAGLRMRVRRSRLLTYAQISPRFLILTHFGVNSLTPANADPIGDARVSDAPQLFLHAAWGEFKVSENNALFIGAGLHYWNGLSRITSASTLNFMTLDNYRQAWAQLGLTDQFARHFGVYAKGRFGKLNYSVAANEPIVNALGSSPIPTAGTTTYSGRAALGPGEAGLILTGYFDYQFLDQESNKLPYRVGTYMGSKKVFNIGLGFFNHADGTVTAVDNGLGGVTLTPNNVTHISVDSYYDAPLGDGAVNAYAAFYSFDYGKNYSLGTTYGTGTSIYGQFGYMLPKFSEKGRLMPYLSYSTRDFEAFANAGNTFQLGANWFLNGHFAKITVQYSSTLSNYTGAVPDRVSALTIQTHLFL